MPTKTQLIVTEKSYPIVTDSEKCDSPTYVKLDHLEEIVRISTSDDSAYGVVYFSQQAIMLLPHGDKNFSTLCDRALGASIVNEFYGVNCSICAKKKRVMYV